MPRARRRPRRRRLERRLRQPPRLSGRRPTQRPRARSRHRGNSERGHMRRRLMRGPKLKHFTPVLALLLLIVAVPLAMAADDTPPNVSYSVDGIVGANTWYRGSIHGDYIVVHWMISDPESPITSAPCEQ